MSKWEQNGSESPAGPPAAGALEAIASPQSEREAYLTRYKKDYEAKAAANEYAKTAPKPPDPEVPAEKTWRCALCGQSFKRAATPRPRCPWGCIHSVEHRRGTAGELTTEIVK